MSWFGKKHKVEDNFTETTSEISSGNLAADNLAADNLTTDNLTTDNLAADNLAAGNEPVSSVQLRVDSAYPGDPGGGKARFDPKTLDLLKIFPGDIVAIEGKRRTVAKVLGALVEDWDQQKVRLDTFTRLNAGVSLGERVNVIKIFDVVEAKRVIIAPPEDLLKKIPMENNPYIMNGLIDFAIAKDDSVPILLGPPFIDSQIVTFRIVEIEPEEAVIINGNTLLEFPEKPEDESARDTSPLYESNLDEKTSEVASGDDTVSSVQLRVDSAYPGDLGGGKARIDPKTLLLLQISPGDTVAIEGKRRTVAKVLGARVEDWDQQKVCLDNFTRLNAGVSLGERVNVVKIFEVVEAKRVIIAPPEDLPKKIPMENNPYIMNGLIDFPIVKDDSVPILVGPPFIEPQIIAFRIVEIEPEEAVIITGNTLLEFPEKPEDEFARDKRQLYENIGGLKDQIQELRDIIDLPVRHPELFLKLGITPPRGVLLYGPPGTGKTLIAKAVASESGVYFISITGPGIISKNTGESEQRIRDVFEKAHENAPSIIFIDELDSIASRSEDASGEVERRVIAQLLSMMDSLEEKGQVFVIGAARRIDLIDPALRRWGRFDREIEICLPDESARIEILKIHSRNMPLSEDINFEDIAKQTDGFSGADLVELCKEAAIFAYKRSLSGDIIDNHYNDKFPDEILNTIIVTSNDLHEAIIKINHKISIERTESTT